MQKLALAVLTIFVAVAFGSAMGPTSSFAQQKLKKPKIRERKRIQEWAEQEIRDLHQDLQLAHRAINGRVELPRHNSALRRHRARLLRRTADIRLYYWGHRPGHGNSSRPPRRADAGRLRDHGPATGKAQPIFVAFASVPFGLDNEGYNLWYYERGGKQMFDELYGQYGLAPFFGGNTGEEIGMHSNKRATKIEDFKGIKVRTVGWYMDILTKMGVSVTPAARTQTRSLGPRVWGHRRRRIQHPGRQHPLRVRRTHQACDFPRRGRALLPVGRGHQQEEVGRAAEDLKIIVETAAKETQLWANAWQENLNIEASKIMQKTTESAEMDDTATVEFRQGLVCRSCTSLPQRIRTRRRCSTPRRNSRKNTPQPRDLRGRSWRPGLKADVLKGRLAQNPSVLAPRGAFQPRGACRCTRRRYTPHAKKFVHAVDAMNEFVGRFTSYMLISLVFVVCYEVFMCKPSNRPTVWASR